MMKDMNQWLNGVRNSVEQEVWKQLLAQKQVGHYQYYGISDSNPGANTQIGGVL